MRRFLLAIVILTLAGCASVPKHDWASGDAVFASDFYRDAGAFFDVQSGSYTPAQIAAISRYANASLYSMWPSGVGLLYSNGQVPSVMSLIEPTSTGVYCLDFTSLSAPPTLTNADCGGGGGGGTPGGSSYSIQYNNSGSFGGLLPGAVGTYCIEWLSLTSNPLLTNSCPSSISFGSLTSGTSTGAAMVMGSGSSLVPSGGEVESTNVPGYATASLPTCNSGNIGYTAYTTDNTPAPVFCNGSSWVGTGGTQFTYAATGCTPSAAVGVSTAGAITLASGPCTSIVITMNGSIGMTAKDGWHCSIGDRTALNGGTWIPNWSESASTTTTATIPIPGASGSTDVITFNCSPY